LAFFTPCWARSRATGSFFSPGTVGAWPPRNADSDVASPALRVVSTPCSSRASASLTPGSLPNLANTSSSQRASLADSCVPRLAWESSCWTFWAVSVSTFGMCCGLARMTGMGVLQKQVRRKERNGSTL
jgi:hypothetical protein